MLKLFSLNSQPEKSNEQPDEIKQPSFQLFFEKKQLLLDFYVCSVKIRPTEDFLNRKLEFLKEQVFEKSKMQLFLTDLNEDLSALPIFPDYIMPSLANVDNERVIYTFAIKNDNTHVAAIHISISEGKECEIKILSVLPAYQGKGLGQILLQVAVYVASLYGCSKITLESLGKNLSFFEQFGFKNEDDYSDEECLEDRHDDGEEEFFPLKGYSLSLTLNNEHLVEFDKKFQENFHDTNFLNVLNYVKQMYGLFNLLLTPKTCDGSQIDIPKKLRAMDIAKNIILPVEVKNMIYAHEEHSVPLSKRSQLFY